MTNPIHVLYMQPSELFGGAERQTAAVLPALMQRGFKVTALVGPGRTIVDWLHAAGVEDVVLSQRFSRDWAESRGLGRLKRARDFFTQTRNTEREVEDLIQDRRIDVVVAGMAFSWVASTPAARRKGVPVIWRVGGMEMPAVLRFLLSLWARRHPPDAMVCNSRAVRDLFTPVIPGPSHLVRNGVDTKLFAPAAGDRALAERPHRAHPVIGFAGRLVPQKRPQDFLAMAARVAARHPDVRFLVAGDGSRRQVYEATARELCLGDRLQFLGAVKDMRAFYGSCDLLVLPSRSEGCPNIVLEAMAMKLPVVASDTPATREVLSHMRDGLLHPVGDVDRLTQAVELLLGAPDLRAALAARALRKVQGPLGIAASADALAGVIRTVVPRQPALALLP